MNERRAAVGDAPPWRVFIAEPDEETWPSDNNGCKHVTHRRLCTHAEAAGQLTLHTVWKSIFMSHTTDAQ